MPLKKFHQGWVSFWIYLDVQIKESLVNWCFFVNIDAENFNFDSLNCHTGRFHQKRSAIQTSYSRREGPASGDGASIFS